VGGAGSVGQLLLRTGVREGPLGFVLPSFQSAASYEGSLARNVVSSQLTSLYP